MSSTHPAAILPQKGGPLVVKERKTPEPGPNEILLEIKAVALNPMDYYQRDYGLPPIPVYPAVIGGDASGIVVKAGSDAATAPAPGTRVAAMATAYWHDGLPDYGAFQKYVIAPSEKVISIPDTITFEDGAVIPLAALTSLTAYTSIGMSLKTRYTPDDKQAILIWGGASSVGTFAVQTARIIGFKVYVTASPKNHDYLKQLGAHACFDYKSDDVISQIVEAVKKDGVHLNTAHSIVIGSLEPTLDILKETKGDKPAGVVYAPVLPPDHPTLDNTTIVWNYPPIDPEERRKHMVECFEWLAGALKDGSVLPSPPAQVEGGGLDGLNAALDKLKASISCAKIVVPI
ncbi:quinone reductase [Immersiella caudata]|uniref:Quinone reductase n=1 Tax=Immersiella caudata TaxID=314043 RepID=A0AA39WPB6_9PEZI|nr:quinone reductase [Immersiella caudata]